MLEETNLAYWVGEGSGRATTDEFMISGQGWTGSNLLRHLTTSLRPTTPYLELSVHSLWSLIAQRTHLIREDPRMATDWERSVVQLLDDDPRAHLSSRAVRELDQLRYATGMVRGTR